MKGEPGATPHEHEPGARPPEHERIADEIVATVEVTERYWQELSHRYQIVWVENVDRYSEMRGYQSLNNAGTVRESTSRVVVGDAYDEASGQPLYNKPGIGIYNIEIPGVVSPSGT